MSRRRRAVLLLGLALILGGLAASDVTRRERAIQHELGPLVPVVVARHDLQAGQRLGPGELALREVPQRYAPAGTVRSPATLLGQRSKAPVPAGAPVLAAQLGAPEGATGPGAPVRVGERAALVVAQAVPDQVQPGARVDVLVTTDPQRAGRGRAELALEDVEVLAVQPAEEAPSSTTSPGPRVAATLRVSVRQAVYLAAAQSFARELRLLPRAPGDERQGEQGTSVDEGLG